MSIPQEKKGGPYTKKQRLDRKNEVLKLHFEYGYSATKISDLMKINRNTINDDINQGYEQLSKDWRKYDLYSILMKQIQRFELQRCRLLQDLQKIDDSKEKLLIEKTIFQIDCKIIQVREINFKKRHEINTAALELVNYWAKKNNWDLRAVNEKNLSKTSPENYKLIKEILASPFSKFELTKKSRRNPQ